jgi:hypothetical protein
MIFVFMTHDWVEKVRHFLTCLSGQKIEQSDTCSEPFHWARGKNGKVGQSLLVLTCKLRKSKQNINSLV